MGSQNTGNSHPRKSANHLRLRIGGGELHHVLGEERPPSERMLSKILTDQDPRSCQSSRHHLASDDLSCSPSTEGRAFFPTQRVSGSLLLDTEVFTVIFTNCWKHGVETDSECGVSVNINSLPQHLFPKILYRFVLLSGQFRFVVNRTGCGVRLPGLPFWLSSGW